MVAPRRVFAILVVLFVCFLVLAATGCQVPRSERGVGGVKNAESFVRKGTGYALLVGISDYADPEIPDLRFAHRDALAWRDFLLSPQGGAFSPQRVRCLTNRQATRGKIIDSISGFLCTAAPEDLVIVFFAGHGTPEHRKKTIPYLLCHDSRPGSYASTAIEMTDLKRKIEDYVNSQRVIIVADACHSAGTESWQQGVRGASGDVTDYWKKLADSEYGRSTVTASRVGELSREDAKWGGGHGVFSHYMLCALKGDKNDRGRTADRSGDGFVTLTEAFDWARPRVESDTQYGQHPFGSSWVDDSIPLGVLDQNLVAELAKRAKKIPSKPDRKAEIMLPAWAVAMPVQYSGRLARDQQDFNHAVALYGAGQTDEAMRFFGIIEETRSGSASRAMLARLAHLLAKGQYAAARSVGLKIGSWFPASADAQNAASRIRALDAAVERANYDAVLVGVQEKPDLPSRIAALQSWIAEQEKLSDTDRSPHVADAKAQILTWQDEIVRQRRGRYGDALKAAQSALESGHPDKAMQSLNQARLDTDDTTEVDQLVAVAKSRLKDKQQRDAFAQASQQERAAASIPQKIKVWQAFLRREAASPLASKARERVEALKQDLKEQLAKTFTVQTAAADKARKAKRFADALLAVVRARQCLTEARQWGFQIAPEGDQALDALGRGIRQEEKTFRQDNAWAAASRSADAELAGRRDEKTYAEATSRLQAFLDKEPDNPHAGQARQRMAELGTARQEYVKSEHKRQSATALAGVDRIEALARRVQRGEQLDADPAAVESARKALAPARDLEGAGVAGLAGSEGLAGRLEKALARFVPVLMVTARSSKTGAGIPAAIYVNGVKQAGTAPARFRMDKGRQYQIELRYDKHQTYAKAFHPTQGGVFRLDATLKYQPLPPGWRSEARRVKVATPQGEERRDITYYTNTIGVQFVKIPPGEFMMGSPANESGRHNDEGPQHRVSISRGFYMGIHELTQAQYEQVMGRNPAHFKGGNNPVERVSWNDAVEFCKRLSHKEGVIYRLPTDAEWEYACRAGTTTRFSFGDSDSDIGEYAWYLGNSGMRTHPVGEKKPNAWGLYDMHGNVGEWCADWYDSAYYRKSPGADPPGPQSGSGRVDRGGCLLASASDCRSAERGWDLPGASSGNLGFRLARTIR